MSELGLFLLKFRNDRNLSQRDLSNLIGLSAPAISKIERSETIPRDKALVKYSEAFNIPISILKDLKYGKIDSQQAFQKLQPISTSGERTELAITNRNFNGYMITEVPYFESISAGIECGLVSDNPLTMAPIIAKKGTFSNIKNLITIKVNGQSMNLVIPNNSIAILDKGIEKPKNGDIIAYQYENSFGLKRFFETVNEIFLVPESTDSHFKKRILSKEELNNSNPPNFLVIGKLIGFYKLDSEDL